MDPISLESAVAQLSEHFQPSAQTAYAFSNAIMTQVVQPAAHAGRPSSPAAGEDALPGGNGAGQNEDHYIFTIRHVSLKKGERMVLPVAEFTLAYQDIYTLDIPFSPPPEVERMPLAARSHSASVGRR